MLALHGGVWAFSSCGKWWGLLPSCGVRSSHCQDFSPCTEWALGHLGFSSCGVWA